MLVALVVAGSAIGIAKLTSGPSSAATSKAVGIYSGTEVPTIMSEDDQRSVELGVRFHVSAPGQVSALRFYRSKQNAGAHTGTLWSGSGQQLATVKFANQSSTGFQIAKLSKPQALQPNVDYVVSYHASIGRYSEQVGTFANGATIGTSSTVRGTQGVYAYGRNTAFPTASWRSSSYYVDVLFTPTGPAVPPSSVPTSASVPATTSAAASSSAASKPPTSAPATSSASSSSAASTSAKAPSSSPAPSSSAPSGGGGSVAGVPAGMVLKTVPGQLTSGTGWRWDGSAVQVTGANAILDGLDINGPVHNSSNNLVITDTRIRCTGETQWCLSLGNNSRVVSTEIGGGANGTSFVAATGVWSGGSGAANVLDKVDIHNTSDGMRVDGGTTLTNSHIHNLSMGDIPGAHSDGIQSTGGANVVLTGNVIETGNNCNVFLQWLSGNAAIASYKISGNTFVAGNRNGEQTSYGVCAYSPDVSGVTITNNTFSHGFQVGPLTTPAGSTVSGNVYTDGTKI
ncbi:MAG: DUF4082 domain-containing protein [Jatrophihabitantaceae bacterium]